MNKLLNAICEALGLPKNVRSIRLFCAVDEIPVIEVELVLTDPSLPDSFKSEFLMYRLEPANDETAVSDFNRALNNG